jgi:hypothetical protein
MFIKSTTTVFTAALFFALSLPAHADTIRLRNGSVIKGKIVEMKSQQITVELDGSSRRSQLTVYVEEIKSIEFDDQAAPIASNNGEERSNQPTVTAPVQNTVANNRSNTTEEPVEDNAPVTRPSPTPNVTITPSRPTTNQPASQNSGGLSQVINSQPTSSPAVLRPNPANGRFIPAVNLKVLADSTANGWTNSGIVVKKGQRIRIAARGRVSLGAGRYATPAGVGSISDSTRLMKTEPTGALIAVIGDDNNEFIYIGSNREFVAERDGTLFLGINEGNLDDNSGAFDATLEAEAIDATAQR